MIDYLKLYSLEKKTAFVTGGAGLIGSEICKALASCGAFTIILDVDEKKGMSLKKEITDSGFKTEFEYFNITDIKNMKNNIAGLTEKYGSVDIWVNSAYPRTDDWGDSVEELKLDSFRKNVDMHFNSYIWSSRLAAMKMKENDIKGSIINLSSIYGVLGNDFTVYDGTDMTSPMAYSAIKGGITNFGRYLASYFGEYGIRVNTICPGGIFANQNKTFVKNYEHKVPLKRLGKPEEIASVIAFIASDAASYITGETVMADGGWAAV